MFLSSYESGVDAKKRVSIPASFRKVLSGEESVFLWPAVDKSCLEGGGEALVRKFQRAISRLRPMDPRREALATNIFGAGRHCKLDEGGRIVLEGDLLGHAGIRDKVTDLIFRARFLVAVGMVFLGQLAIGGLDLRLAGIGLHAQNVVIIFEFHCHSPAIRLLGATQRKACFPPSRRRGSPDSYG